MIKMLGAIAVILASVGFLEGWKSNYRQRILQLQEMIELYEKASYMMEVEQTYILIFFERNAKNDNASSRMLACLIDNLRQHAFRTGKESWENAFEQTSNLWKLENEEKEFLLRSSDGFFGRCTKENIVRLNMYAAQMQIFCDQAKASYREKNKIVTPVSMLMGIMLIIILV